MTSRLIKSRDCCISLVTWVLSSALVMWLTVNAINDMTDGVTNGGTDHVVIVITSELVNDLLVSSLLAFV